MIPLLKQITLFTCLSSTTTLSGYVHSYKSLCYASEIIIALQNFFHTGCITIFHSGEENILALREIWLLLNRRNPMTNFDAYVTVPQYTMYNYSIRCRRNRPLYVLFSDDKQLFRHVMKRLNMTNARWLLFLSNNNRSLEDRFHEVDIPMDRELFVAQMQEKIVHLTEVYRVHPTFPLEIHTMGNWSYAGGLQCLRSPFYKRRNNMKGLKFKAVLPKCDPATPLEYLGNNTYSARGYFGSVWSALEKKLNFSTHFLEPETEWGTQMNGKWMGMIGKIVRKEVDVALAAFSIVNFRLSYIDFLPPLINSREMLFIRKPEEWIINWSIFLLPFKWNLWICIISALFMLAMCLSATSYLQYQHGASEPRIYQFSDSLFFVLGSFCSQGQDTTPKSWACRFVYIVSFLLGVVLLAAYSAALVSFSTVQRPEMPFYDLKGLLSEESYRFYIARGSLLDYFRTSNDATVKSLYKKMIAPKESELPTLLEGLKNACQDSKYVFMSSIYAVNELARQGETNCTLVSFPETKMVDVLSIILQKNSPYTKILSHSIQEMRFNGELRRLNNLQIDLGSQNTENDTFGVDIQSVVPILTILAGGILISIFAVFGEILMCRHIYKKRKIYSSIYHNEDEKNSEKCPES